ncbi:BofC C-terminal domain-containing protein [Paenibacillus oryzisoli]|uniref:BofC C-terminal domain-containing protein n=1 Tax=Paenibacillus oryzisoli TaxID=1850517 RepID=UPI003D2758D8
MIVQRFLKHLKRRLRWKRSWLALGMFVLLGTAFWIGYESRGAAPFNPLDHAKKAVSALARISPAEDVRLEKAIETLRAIQDQRESYLLKSYVCGEERSPLGLLASQPLIELQKKHPDWELAIGSNGDVTFTEHIEDLSPACKEKAMFGIDGSSNLSLFNGTPGADNVIRTFFQLNIQQLESSLPPGTVEQLRKGIRVSDLEEYNSVLSTFSDYAIEITERAMTTP